jgi:transglutaminase-like putative cysteine protease
MIGEKRTYYIKHVHRIAFHVPVYCEPTVIRLHPRTDEETFVRSMRLDISPHPAGMRSTTDLAGNVIWQAWFSDITLSLNITATSVVDRYVGMPTTRQPAHQSIVLPEDPELLECYRRRCTTTSVSEELVAELAALGRNASESAKNANAFLLTLAQTIAGQFRWQCHLEHPSESTNPEAHGASLEKKRLVAAEEMADVARCFRFPTRLVRGYLLAESPEIEYAARIWTESFLPNVGWVGIDPTTGLLVDKSYVPIAAGRDAASVACVQGAVRGSKKVPETRTQIIVRAAADVERVDLSEARLPHSAVRPR